MALAGPLKLMEKYAAERKRVLAEKEAKTRQVEDRKNLKVGKLEIVRATYGADNTWKDVTKQVQGRAANNRRILLGSYNGLAGDPVKDVVKTLKIEYKIDGKRGKAEFSENAEVLLPKP